MTLHIYICTFSEILSVIFLVLRRWKSYGAHCNEYTDGPESSTERTVYDRTVLLCSGHLFLFIRYAVINNKEGISRMVV
jgi:hypothetical protein